MKRLVAVDLDGTLLTSEKRISKRTRDALNKVVELGGDVVIATGRPPRTSVFYREELGLTTPLVNFNGALIHGGLLGATEIHTPVDSKAAQSVLKICYEIGTANLMVEIKDEFYLHTVDYVGDPIMDMGDRRPAGIGNLLDLVNDDVTSIVIRSYGDKVERLLNGLSKIHAEDLTIRYWAGAFHTIEVMSSRASKATGVSHVAHLLGYTDDQVIAFGDEMNDVEMLLQAGTGVAMGNAREAVQSVADYVTATCDEDGIADFLEQHVLQNVPLFK